MCGSVSLENSLPGLGFSALFAKPQSTVRRTGNFSELYRRPVGMPKAWRVQKTSGSSFIFSTDGKWETRQYLTIAPKLLAWRLQADSNLFSSFELIWIVILFLSVFVMPNGFRTVSEKMQHFFLTIFLDKTAAVVP